MSRSKKKSPKKSAGPKTSPALSEEVPQEPPLCGSLIDKLFTTPRPRGRFDLGAFERQFKSEILSEGAKRLETALNECVAKNPAPFVCPRCKRSLRNKGLKPKTLTTSLGEIVFRRRYGFCEGCKKGLFPDDEMFGLDPSSRVRALPSSCFPRRPSRSRAQMGHPVPSKEAYRILPRGEG